MTTERKLQIWGMIKVVLGCGVRDHICLAVNILTPLNIREDERDEFLIEFRKLKEEARGKFPEGWTGWYSWWDVCERGAESRIGFVNYMIRKLEREVN